MINSIYGKTMENLRKRENVRLINNAKDYEKYGSKSTFFYRRHLVKNSLLFMKLNQILHLIKQYV